MGKYQDEKCIVCNDKINDLECAICPDCGAPSHRHCVNKKTICSFCNNNGNKQYTYEHIKILPNKSIDDSNSNNNSTIIPNVKDIDVIEFIDKNDNYFTNKFNTKISLNFCALFLGLFYYVYRKMYKEGLVLMLILTTFQFLLEKSLLNYDITFSDFLSSGSSFFIDYPISATIFTVYFFIILAQAFLFNHLYKLRIQNVLQSVNKLNYTPEIRKKVIEQQGGVSAQSTILLVVIMGIMSITGYATSLII